ncbi:MAG: response regulator [Candidatus Eremiobacteraeota bacterium]|nr:response regulator [Candidatus Eremiobacteraeota bacterium]
MPKVLIVDDSRFQRSRVKQALAPCGWDLVEAGDGEEGVEAVERERPDLIVTDLLMPKKTGLEMLATLRERGCSTPVVVLTADIQNTSRDACLAHGVKAFLNKPFSGEDLLQVLAAELDAA